MNYSKYLLRKTLWLTIAFGMAVLATGCSFPTKATKTVGLPGIKPLASADQVKLIEKIEDVKQPYQIVGQAAIIREGMGLDQGASYKRMKEIAAGMGADGLIGLHEGFVFGPPVTYFRSGLAVKWLAQGETKRELAVPFIVGVLPIILDPNDPSKKSINAESLRMAVLCPLEVKGYYVLPVQQGDFKGGIEKAKMLDDTELRVVGGENAQLLLGLTVEASANTSAVVVSGSTASIKTTLMDKRTRKTVFEGRGFGTVTVGWLVDAIVPNEKLATAAREAARYALKTLPAIYEEIPY
jgi:hypothetical protein